MNALFIQPTYFCKNNCKDCYVKARLAHPTNNEGNYLKLRYFRDLVDLLHSGKIWTNQITLSLDVLPETRSEYSLMLDYFNLFLGRILLKKIDKREIHLTFNSLNSFLEYRSASLIFSYSWRTHDYQNFITMTSFSNIKKEELPFIKELRTAIKVNYNHRLPYVDSTNIKSYINTIQKIADNVDSIYLIIDKDPVGSKISNERELFLTSRLRSNIVTINTLKKYLSKDAWSKCHIDGCLQDIIKHRQTGFGCSSNISRFQLWPDGSVSGCPYSIDGINTATHQDIRVFKNNIKAARKQYDFLSRCYLPRIYNNICRGSENIQSTL